MVNSLGLREGLMILEDAFLKTRKIMDGSTNVKFTPEEYQRYYECVYLLCIQKTAENPRILYERYKSGLEECINSLVIPSLEGKTDSYLLTEFVLRWFNYQTMARWLSRFFDYLDRFYLPRIGAFGLQEQALKCFHDLVNPRFSTNLIAAVISLINCDRNGGMIDRRLLKDVREYFEVSKRVGGTCLCDLEKALLADAAAYYSQIASKGLLHDSCAEYMYKVRWFLNQESERADHFLDLSTKEKLLQVVKFHLLDQALATLSEKQKAESHGRSTDYEDLLSMCAGLNIGDHGSRSEADDLMMDRS